MSRLRFEYHLEKKQEPYGATRLQLRTNFLESFSYMKTLEDPY